MSLPESLLLTIEAGSLAPSFSPLGPGSPYCSGMEIQFERVKIHGRCVNARETNSQKSAQSQAEGKAPPRKQGSSSGGRLSTFAAASTARVRQIRRLRLAYPSAARRGEAPAARQREDVGIEQEESRRGRQTQAEAPKRKQSRKSAYGHL